MDPNAAYRIVRDKSYSLTDRKEAARGLLRWVDSGVNSGGFMPTSTVIKSPWDLVEYLVRKWPELFEEI